MTNTTQPAAVFTLTIDPQEMSVHYHPYWTKGLAPYGFFEFRSRVNRAAEGRNALQLHDLFPVLVDACHVDMGDEVIRVGASEHGDLATRVGLGLLDQGDQIPDQLGPEEIHWRGRDFREQHGAFPRDIELFESHCSCLYA